MVKNTNVIKNESHIQPQLTIPKSVADLLDKFIELILMMWVTKIGGFKKTGLLSGLVKLPIAI